MSPLTAVMFAVVVSVPPVAPEPEPPQGVWYVHSLSAPAVDVTGLDPTFLTQSVPIAKCESTHREAAVNLSGATGLMQVMLPLHLPKAQALGYTGADLLRAEPNLRVAHVIWERQGWKPWSCWRGQ